MLLCSANVFCSFGAQNQGWQEVEVGFWGGGGGLGGSGVQAMCNYAKTQGDETVLLTVLFFRSALFHAETHTKNTESKQIWAFVTVLTTMASARQLGLHPSL